MTLAKGKGSSRRKEKEIAVDDPVIKVPGEDAPLSESECSEEEEGSHDLDSECAPLIDLWYDTHMHFLVVPGDYLPPLLGYVWLSVCHRDTEVFWAALASSILDLDIR